MAYDVEGEGVLIIFLSAITLPTNECFIGRTMRCISHVGLPHEF